ncbi:hypothetical protein VaNZ11_016200 [Volvox africanus]|uniref:BTB domain-containing protein n=1 Tax=Volvox africanus TaxID=51714 RepID=A0ABQ5SMG5_9CHLO|nr:hypothetical protein VaNZ11_016200 [Volvox africanus]
MDTADAQLEFPDGRTLPCHSQILAAWSGVVRDLLQSGTYCEFHVGGDEVVVGHGEAGATSDGNRRPSTAEYGPGSGSGVRLRIPVMGEESLEDWERLLELMYPPTRLPRPTITWDNIDTIILLADKYGMSGLLLLCEEFLLERGGKGGGAATGTGSGGGSSSGGSGAFYSCDPDDPAYVWKWLGRADRLRMERVCSECMDFICSEAMLGPGGAHSAGRGEADEEMLEGLRGGTLRRLVSRLVRDTATMKAALRNEGMKVSTAVPWSCSVGAFGSTGANLTEQQRWQLSTVEGRFCRWHLRGS